METEIVRFVAPARNTTVVLRSEKTLKADGIVVKPLRIHFTDFSFTTSDPELIQQIRNSDQYGKFVNEVENAKETKDRLVGQKLDELRALGVNIISETPTPVPPAVPVIHAPTPPVAEPDNVGRDDEVGLGAVAPETTPPELPPTSAKVYTHEDGTQFTDPLALYRYRKSKGEVIAKKKK